jgi:phosphatidate phosphatase APP1
MADWKKRLTEFASRVETNIDRQKERLGTAVGTARPARIEAYRGFGTAERAYVKGRVLRGLPLPAAAEGDGVLINLAGMIQRFESDEVPGARVLVRYPGGSQEVTADEEGYFDAWIEPRPAFPAGRLWHDVEMALLHPVDPAAPPAPVPAHVLVPPADARFGVISDLDDTVVRTDATNTLRMVRNVFLANARTRVPFPGVAAFYRALQRGMGGAAANPVFYVSSSPWNLHDLLTEFLTLQDIPVGPLMLRDWGLNADEVLPTGHGRHKLEQIRRVMETFPALPFILIGDSGQEDPEIYAKVVHENPSRILGVYIRNVTPAPARADFIRKLGEELRQVGGTLVLTDDTLAAAEDAARRGWIDPAALPEIGHRAAQDVPTEPTQPGTARTNDALSTDAPG